jgi:DMSO reductase anchor subunit
MKERSLAAFTILSQMAIGAFWLLSVLNGLNAVKLLILTAIMLVALATSFLHLGTAFNAWRAFSGWRSSWLSREVLCAALFTALLGGLALAAWRQIDLAGTGMWLAALCGLVPMYTQAYRLRTVPIWNHWTTAASFSITTLLLAPAVWRLGARCGWLICDRLLAAASDRRRGHGKSLAVHPTLRLLAASARDRSLSLVDAWLAAFLLALSGEVLARALFYEMRQPRSVWRFAAHSTLSRQSASW